MLIPWLGLVSGMILYNASLSQTLGRNTTTALYWPERLCVQCPLLPRGALDSVPPRPQGANQSTCQWFPLRAAAAALKHRVRTCAAKTPSGLPHGPLWLRLSALSLL